MVIGQMLTSGSPVTSLQWFFRGAVKSLDSVFQRETRDEGITPTSVHYKNIYSHCCVAPCDPACIFRPVTQSLTCIEELYPSAIFSLSAKCRTAQPTTASHSLKQSFPLYLWKRLVPYFILNCTCAFCVDCYSYCLFDF